MDEVPPEVVGHERYWRTARLRVHKEFCGYARNSPMREWACERGRSWREIDDEARRHGKVILWCMRCFPQSHPAIRDGGVMLRVGRRITYRFSHPENSQD